VQYYAVLLIIRHFLLQQEKFAQLVIVLFPIPFQSDINHSKVK
jgi:hypothetical protein